MESVQHDETILKGIPISPGSGLGRPCYYTVRRVPALSQASGFSGNQTLAFMDVFHQLESQLESLVHTAESHSHDDSVAIFNAHRMILCELKDDILNHIVSRQVSARHAIEKCFDNYADYFSTLDRNYLSERASDFNELKYLLVNLLDNTRGTLSCKDSKTCEPGECALGNSHILITEELTAHIAIRIHGKTKGIITERCGLNSHAAVIARSLEIPVVSGISGVCGRINCDDTVLIDGDRGRIFINPDETTLGNYSHRIKPRRGYTVISKPLEHFRVLANLDLSRGVGHAREVRADGIGLYRSELEMLVKGDQLSEQEQFECYRSIIEEMPDKPVYIRLFDLGSDKTVPGVDLGKEENPALGCRGARLLLARPELLQTQARAIARASRQSLIHVIYPMIATCEQFKSIKRLFEDAIRDIEGINLRHGMMFEVPSACENAAEFYRLIDFGRVGCNDLIQYLFAVDRGRDDFDVQALARDPAIWNLLKRLVSVAREHGKPLEVCGALADHAEFVPGLIQIGIDTISTHCENIAVVRKTARRCLAEA